MRVLFITKVFKHDAAPSKDLYFTEHFLSRGGGADILGKFIEKGSVKGGTQCSNTPETAEAQATVG